ncbi:MAG: ABC transporter permease [Halanaerobiales bacterium]
MDYIYEGFKEAVKLLVALEPEIVETALLSAGVSTTSTLLASLLGVPLGFIIAYFDFKGRRLVITGLNTLLSLPTVVVGLLGFALISSRGPLGELNLLFTPAGIVIGQFVLALPIVTTLSLNVIREAESKIINTALSLGASFRQAVLLMFREVKFGLLGAVITAFGRVIGEVGISMMLGGNISGVTRTLTTTIALETSRGAFSLGLALGLILMLISLLINFGLHYFQEAAV